VCAAAVTFTNTWVSGCTRVKPMLAQEVVQRIVDERQQLLARGPDRGENLHGGPQSRPEALWAHVNGEKTSCAAPSRFERYPCHSESMRVAIHIPRMLPDNDFHFRLGHAAPAPVSTHRSLHDVRPVLRNGEHGS
jgi:hypothetical protein